MLLKVFQTGSRLRDRLQLGALRFQLPQVILVDVKHSSIAPGVDKRHFPLALIHRADPSMKTSLPPAGKGLSAAYAPAAWTTRRPVRKDSSR